MNLRVIIDTREQRPLAFPPDVEVVSRTLATGDYALVGLEDHTAIERKELSDLLNCITTARDRFKRELQRLRAYACRAVVVEADLSTILAGAYRSRVHPAAVVGSIASWTVRYQVPFIFAGDHAGAAVIVLALLKAYQAQIKELVEALNSPARDEADF